MSRKVLHLENKKTGEHRYYGSLVALCLDNKDIIPPAFYHTLKRINFKEDYVSGNYTIRRGELLSVPPKK